MKKWIKSPWGISLGTAIISLLLTMGYDALKEVPILTTVWNILVWIWNTLISILNLNLKVWWIIVVIGLVMFIIYIIDKFKQEGTVEPDFLSYREGKIEKWKWSWSYHWNHSKNKWIIDNLRAHCPKCDTPMVDNTSIFSASYDCPRCDFHAYQSDCDDPGKVERIIIDNIERHAKDNIT